MIFLKSAFSCILFERCLFAVCLSCLCSILALFSTSSQSSSPPVRNLLARSSQLVASGELQVASPKSQSTSQAGNAAMKINGRRVISQPLFVTDKLVVGYKNATISCRRDSGLVGLRIKKRNEFFFTCNFQ